MLYLKNKAQKAAQRDKMSDDEPVQDKIEALDFDGHVFYLSESDKKAWKALSNSQRQQIHLKQRELIKAGALVKVKEGDKVIGLVTRAEALRIGLIK